MTRPFLTARWRHLVMLNYAVDPGTLRPHLPPGVEIDFREGECLVSIVGFLFERTRLRGWLPIPFHESFEEVNLRYYVKRTEGAEVRRGVAFVRELVPSRSVTFVARRWYNENYLAVPMSHEFRWNDEADPSAGGTFVYRWGRKEELSATTEGRLAEFDKASLAGFITERCYGYSARPDGGTDEYRVEHPPWRVWGVKESRHEGEIPFGGRFHSALVAEGSDVSVFPAAVINQTV